MREIEVKARVHDITKLMHSLETQGIELGEELEQHDMVFGQPSRHDNEPGSIWLRIRTENKAKSYFTLKKAVRGHLDSIEHETIIEDPKEIESIVRLLGFEPHSNITKFRRKAKVGVIEICVDRLGKLGNFIEAEMLVQDEADYKEVEAKLWELLEKLGMNKNDEELRGYDVIERQSRGL